MKARIAADVREPDGKKYEYRRVTVSPGKGWALSVAWGAHAPLPEVSYDKRGRLVLRLRRVKGA